MLELSLNCSENGTRVFNEDLRSLRLKYSGNRNNESRTTGCSESTTELWIGGGRFLPVISYLSLPSFTPPDAEYEISMWTSRTC